MTSVLAVLSEIGPDLSRFGNVRRFCWYFMLTRGEDYVDQGQQTYEQQQRERSISALRRRATDLGFDITPTCVPA